MFKSAAWPLALLYGALIVFASLFPFEGWRAQGISPWSILTATFPPQYWTWFDVNINIAGYVPLGFLLAVGILRGSARHWAVPVAVLGSGLLALSMEWLQLYLPRRVPSNMDLALNIVGSLLGALLAVILAWLGVLRRWSSFRERWFGPQPHSGIALLAMWPWALLFPAALPFGIGQILERLDKGLALLFEGTPAAAWLPLRETAGLALSPMAEMLCVALGLLAPCLLAYMLIEHQLRRVIFSVLLVIVGVSVTTLSCALGYGPGHAWAWLGLPASVGIIVALLAALTLSVVPRRWCAVLLLLGLMLQLNWLNQAPSSAYFAQTLQIWEQGRFIRFYGVGQWLGWIWPYAVLLYTALRLARRDTVQASHIS